MKKGNNAIFFSLFLAPVPIAFLTSSSLYVVPVVYGFWLLLLISLFSVVTFQLQIFRAYDYTFRLINREFKGRIICFVTSFNENPRMLLTTLLSVKNANPSGETWLLDDSTDPEIVSRLKEICEKLDVPFIHRDHRRGFKAGAINDALKMVPDDYEILTVFDSDQIPTPRFFSGIMGYFSNPKIAFVQIPQTYTDLPTRISKAAYFQQEVFLRKIMRGRSDYSAFILGSGFVARISALESVGGFYEDNVTEDLATSILLHEKGWLSAYIDTSEIWYGKAPETISGYLKQQGRWSLGGFQTMVPLLRSNISTKQFVDYFAGFLYWLWVGPVRLISLFAMIFFLVFHLYTVFINPIFFAIFYFPYLIYSLLFYAYTVSDRSMDYKTRGFMYHQGAELLLMFTVTASFIAFIFRRKKPFVVTPKGQAGSYSLGQAIPFIIVELVVTTAFSAGLVWLRYAFVPLLRIAIYLNLFFAIYLIPFLITGSVILFTSEFKPSEKFLLRREE